MELIGIVGVLFLVVAWLPPTVETLKKRKSEMNMWFQLLFFIGACLLTAYSISINDYVFMALNAIAALLAFVNLTFIPNKIKSIEHDIDEINGNKGKKYYHVKKRKRYD